MTKTIYLFNYNLQNYQISLPQPSKRNHFGIKSYSYQSQKPVFLLKASETCSKIELFFILSQTLFGTNHDQNKNNVIEFVDQLLKKILLMLYVWTLKILYSNKRILTQCKCLFEHSIIPENEIIFYIPTGTIVLHNNKKKKK